MNQIRVSTIWCKCVIGLALVACAASPERAAIRSYAASDVTPTIPLALAGETVWYADANSTAILPFNASTDAFGTPIADPTTMPDASRGDILRGAFLAPKSLARSLGGTLWGVGTAEKRLGFSGYASSTAIVEYDPRGFSKAYPIPNAYHAGHSIVDAPNGKLWSMVWTHGMRAEVVQINRDGTISPEFSVARNALPEHAEIRFARFGRNGIVWLLQNGFQRTEITRWTLGSPNPTKIALPIRGFLRCETFTTAPDGAAWVAAQEVNGTVRGKTHFYRITPTGKVTHFESRASSLLNSCTATMFWAGDSMWAISVVDRGSSVGESYLLHLTASGAIMQSEILGARGLIAEVGPSVVKREDVFLSSFSGSIPVLRFKR